jgi:hypothetical protein
MPTLSSTPIPTITTDEYQTLVSSVTNDTLTWGSGNHYPGFGAVPITGGGTGTGYVYTSPNTVPWITTTTGTNPAMVVNQGGVIDIAGENADIKMNGKSMKAWMEKVEERLNILTPNPDMERDWDELRRLGERYRRLEKKCREKARMWEELKRVQPKQS